MFEDNAQPMQPAQSGQAPDAKPATPQAVEDIFADTDSTPTPPQSPPQAGGESMIQPGPPTALTSGKLKPLAQDSGQAVPQGQVSGVEESRFPFKTFGIIIGVIFGISAIGSGAYFVFKSQLPQVQEQNVGTPQDTTQNTQTNTVQNQDTTNTENEQNTDKM